MVETSLTPTPLLDLDTLRTLVAIADSGNFSAAAQAVFRTPSAVSMQVKKAEQTVGRSLFMRDSRSVVATHDGELLVQHGRRMLALNREVMTQFVKPDVAGTVRLGAPDDTAERMLPAMLRRFASTYCCVVIDVVVENSVQLLSKVREGALDLAIVTSSEQTQGARDVDTIFHEGLTWAGRDRGIAHEQEPLPVSVWEEGCAWRNMGLASLQQMKRNYRIAFMSAHISGQRAAILADLAVAPIPESSCTDGIVCLDERHGLPELGRYSLGLVVASKSSQPAQAAAEYLRANFAEHEAISPSR